MNDEAAVRKLIESWADAVRRQDLDGILAHHSADMVMFDVPPPTQLRGLAAYAQSWGPFFEAFRSGGVFEIASLEVTASDDLAFACALLRCEPDVPAAEAKPRLRLTVCLRKEHGSWIVVHEHHSYPQ